MILNFSDKLSGKKQKAGAEHFCDVLGVSYTAWDAIKAWHNAVQASSLSRSSKSNYISSMLLLIKKGIVDYKLPLLKITNTWYTKAEFTLYNVPSWSETTKICRKTCLKSFYDFVSQYQYKDYVKNFGEPSREAPTMDEVTAVLSNIQERSLAKDLDFIGLFQSLRDINERDSIILTTLLFTARKLDDILNLKKKDCVNGFLTFEDGVEKVPLIVTNFIKKHSTNENDYAFTSIHGKRLRSNQIIRNLKKSSKQLRLNYEATPRVLLGFAKRQDKLSDFETFINQCN
jgi:hypothetical protein